MSYTPHNFVNGEIIEAEPINEMDRQIQQNEIDIAGKLNKSDVYNGLDYTEAGKALDARQGKALNDAVAGKVNTSDVANNVTTTKAGKVLDARQGKALHDAVIGKISSTEKGAAGGVAELDQSGMVPAAQLPPDILEYESYSEFPVTGEAGKIYVDTSTNIIYRWNGTRYVAISSSGGGGGGGMSVDDIPFTIATTDWVEAAGGGYTATVSSAAISSLSKEIVLYDSSIKQLTGDIVATKDAENSSMIFKTTSIPSGTISGDIYSFTDVGSARAVFKDIQFSIAVADWTGESAPYTAQVLDSFVTEDSGIWVFFDDSYDSYASGAVWAAVNSAGTGIAFSTDSKPTGTITGFVRVVDGVSGTIPVSLGGTGVTSIPELKEVLNINDMFSVVNGKVCITYNKEVDA